ncbi:MAG TPA: NADH-quinone oxidoreductase subunit H [Elusimicrobia bacterium]|nr:NADH-quinone oxidoreductase subunit H [Elusimicrobiota bacterium]HBT61942.1 NADH-quinone oxidoreductase subunit H [Elusimicrobiota bacterium]
MTLAAWTAFKVACALGFGLGLAGLLGWVERKQSAVLQDRIGANRASILGLRVIGLFHPLADALKLLSKEDMSAPGGLRLFHALAPMISLGCALACLAALPFGGSVEFSGRFWQLQPLPSPAGLVYVLALLAVGVHGVIMAGYASGSNYGLLGGMRGAAQMVAYEVCMAAILAGPMFLYGTLDLQEAVFQQGRCWGIFTQPLAFVLFLVAGAAATKRIPFDLPEGESEIVGYHVEYSGMKFGMFMMTDFVESVVVSGLGAALFLGGWQVPFIELRGLLGALVMVASFSAKTCALLFLLMQVRWTLPRFRFDQLLDLGWKSVLPLALANFLATVWGAALFGGLKWR